MGAPATFAPWTPEDDLLLEERWRISRTQQDHEGELKQSVRVGFRIDQRSRFATSIYQHLHTGRIDIDSVGGTLTCVISIQLKPWRRLIELELVARGLLEPDVSLCRWGVTRWCCPMGWLPLPELAKLRVVFYKTQDHSIDSLPSKTLHGILDARANASVVVEPANVVAEPANVVTKQAGHSPCTCLKRHLKDPVRLARTLSRWDLFHFCLERIHVHEVKLYDPMQKTQFKETWGPPGINVETAGKRCKCEVGKEPTDGAQF
ncbi:hypothetical protein VNO77_04199 [Canavalia gladiata]|uniref:Uncharacterized protein n=1 Tax=Canavalia gladiata TaxID=3824 RepID=A0AAN9MW76_CANGL